jgi:hypothetical protein
MLFIRFSAFSKPQQENICPKFEVMQRDTFKTCTMLFIFFRYRYQNAGIHARDTHQSDVFT